MRILCGLGSDVISGVPRTLGAGSLQDSVQQEVTFAAVALTRCCDSRDQLPLAMRGIKFSIPKERLGLQGWRSDTTKLLQELQPGLAFL